MNAPFDPVDNRRAIIDPRRLTEELAGAGRDLAARILCDALEAGRAEIARRLIAHPARGRSAARATFYLHSQLLLLAYEHVTGDKPPELAIVGSYCVLPVDDTPRFAASHCGSSAVRKVSHL